MKKLIFLTLITLATIIVAVTNSTRFKDRDYYISQIVLDTANPLDVTIDVEFLQKLVPAYE